MISTLSFGHPPPPGAHSRLSISSSPASDMSSNSDSPINTPNFDSTLPPLSDARDDARVDSRLGSNEIIPKVEEQELQLADVKTEPVADEPPISPMEPMRIRRGRGRPRIYPPRSPTTSSKAAKARSKTGCTTCRKRKKKCDETKPFCEHSPSRPVFAWHADMIIGLSCQKNNIHCEGYKPVELWKSGKERAAEGKQQPFASGRS